MYIVAVYEWEKLISQHSMWTAPGSEHIFLARSGFALGVSSLHVLGMIMTPTCVYVSPFIMELFEVFDCLYFCFKFSSPQVLREQSEELEYDHSTIYAKPVGTPPGSQLNVSAAEFVPRSGSAFSIASLPAPVTRTVGQWGTIHCVSVLQNKSNSKFSGHVLVIKLGIVHSPC